MSDGGRAFALGAELGSPGAAAALWTAYDALGLDGASDAARWVTGRVVDATGGTAL
ncbi:hypothetical protein [Streptomyces avidinii]|uniref:hypothetical protein n=1 Tax=Streptomyces avidinii TaxID=1895 RepID=UPI00387051F4